MKLISKLKAKCPAWLWAGAVSGVAAAVGTFVPLTLGWLTRVADWASSSGATEFPSLTVLGYGAVSAAVGLATGVVNAVYRWVQSRSSLIPGDGPTYTKGA